MSEPLYSSYADDEDMLELVEMFVAELPDRMASVTAALDGGDYDQLQVYAHQLKGSAGSYGFQSITDAAAGLEDALKSGSPNPAILKPHADALLDLLDRASADPQS